MVKHRYAPIVALLFAMFARTAHAYFGTPYITAATPAPGDTLYVNVYQGGHCDLIDGGGNPSYPQITQQGSSVRILFLAYRYTDPQDCIFSEGTTTWPIGTYSPGTYSLQVDIYYRIGFDPWQTETLGILPFTVAGGSVTSVPVPTLGLITMAFLGLLLATLGAWRVRTNGIDPTLTPIRAPIRP